jgi:hypothetical protein
LNGGKGVRSGGYEGVLASLKFQRKTCWLVSVTLCTGVDKSSFYGQRKEINQLTEGEEKSHSFTTKKYRISMTVLIHCLTQFASVFLTMFDHLICPCRCRIFEKQTDK